ncbi:MAG: flagellar hook-associated protein FlgK [Alphaproteobacteria bacterium]|nr:flagellar hook-associated protein FlgK [Alphaproteobacteria bacterium]
MSGSLTLALRTAQSGLLVNQSALDAVAQNVANVNSPDYSRKIVQLEQRVVAGIGAGVQLSEVRRAVDEGLLKSLREEISTFNQKDAQTSYYERMQDLFGAPQDNNSIVHVMNEFGKAIEALTVAPDQSLEQSEMVRQAQEIIGQLQQMSNTIQELRNQADVEIYQVADQINTLNSDLVTLNNSIIQNATTGADVTDLYDKRDAKLDELAGLIDIAYFYRGDGDVAVFTTAGKTLVDNKAVSVVHNPASATSPTTTHAEGDFAPIYIGAQISVNDVTNQVRDGKLKGLVELRDSVLPGLQSQLDEMAAELRDSINLVHNRGVPYPGVQSMSGNRAFLDGSTQTITMGNNSDTRIMLFDGSGNQYDGTTLQTIMQSANYGTGAQAANGPWTIDEVAASIEDWLQASGASGASVSVDSSTKKLNIELNTTAYNLAFRDEVNSSGTVPAPVGSTQTDATIKFDSDGDTVIDETVSGFSNFFGLNDFFVDDLADNIWESEIMASGFGATVTGGSDTIRVWNGSGAVKTVTVNSGDTLGNIRDNINNANIGVTASLIPDGSGYRLRIASNDGTNITVTQASGDQVLTDMRMHSADVRVSLQLDVRDDIKETPGNISRGIAQWDSSRGASGEYFISKGDNTLIKAIAQTFSGSNTFDAAGSLSSVSVSFTVRATSILSHNATKAELNYSQRSYQNDLTSSLKHKSDTFRGVNIDEEMSNLILYEQAYAAAARVVSVIQNMFEALDRVIG